MDGIILTRGIGGGSPAYIPIEVSIAAGDIELIDTFDASICPFITWHISASDRVSSTNSTRFLIISALHDFEGNADFNCSSIIGIEYDLGIAVVTGTPDTNMILSITNNEAFDLEIYAIRVIGS